MNSFGRCLRNLCAIGVLGLVVSIAAADTWLAIDPRGALSPKESGAATAPQAVVVRSDLSGLNVTFGFAGLRSSVLKTPRGAFVRLDWPDSAVAGAPGAPALPVERRFLLAPPDATVSVHAIVGAPVALNADQIGSALRLMPVQPPILKIPGAAQNAEFVLDDAAYAVAGPLPAQRASIEEVGIVAGQRLFLLEVRPLAYDAVAQTAAFWPRIDVQVTFQGGSPMPQNRPAKQLRHIVLNPDLLDAAPRAAGNFLIIAGNPFATAIGPFAAAKTAQGYTVATWTAPVGATAAQIKTYIQTQWTNPETAPEYVLLVGDTNTIPNWIGQGEGTPNTDLQYVCMDGTSDWMPDIGLGRMSVRSTAQLDAVVAKTLYLENGPLADPGYLLRAVFMASEDNYTISEGTHEWVITNYMDKENFESDRLYSHTYHATTQQVRDAFNAGRIFGIYSGHGDTDYWADGPVFTQADVNGLFNADMYSFVCSFACLTGNYVDTECFSETWLLAPQKGGAAVLASSTYSYWTEDDVLEKKLFAVLYDDYIRELGPCLNLTKLHYLQQMGSGPTTRRYFEMYNLLGDPALAIPAGLAALRVTPGGDFVAEGPEGGPFLPASAAYSVRNVADSPIDYVVSVAPGADWIALSGDVAGTLAPDGQADISVAINENAALLPVGVHTATINFTNTTDHLGDTTREVRLEVGRYVYHPNDLPKPIPDYSTVTSTITVPEIFCVGDVDVDVDITHTYIGDLLITLQSPLGSTVTLHNRTGGGTDNLVVRYDDDATAPDGPGSLADFNNGLPIGDWTLTVRDMAGGDTGTLNSWSLRMLPVGSACPPRAYDDSVQTPQNQPIAIRLRGQTDLPALLDFIIMTLPGHGTLSDPAGGAITSVPFTLTDYGDVVLYQPALCYNGDDRFEFMVHDGRDSNIATIDITVGGPQAVHRFPLDSNPGWTTQGQWAFGRPLGGGSHNLDPTSGHTGTSVYGYNLAGDYADSMPVQYLTTRAIDCTGLTGVELHFWRWLGIESSSWDHASVQVSNNGTTWTTVWDHSGDAIADTVWTPMTLDVSAVADNQPTVYVRWSMGPTDSSVTYPGWNLDDIELWAMAPGALPGDLDADSDVDLADLAALLSEFGCTADCAADIDGDGVVDLTDLATLLSHFGAACP